MADHFPVAFLYFVNDFECSQVLQFIHDEMMDVYDVYQHGVNVIGFLSLEEFENCMEFCSLNHFTYVSYVIQKIVM